MKKILIRLIFYPSLFLIFIMTNYAFKLYSPDAIVTSSPDAIVTFLIIIRVTIGILFVSALFFELILALGMYEAKKALALKQEKEEAKKLGLKITLSEAANLLNSRWESKEKYKFNDAYISDDKICFFIDGTYGYAEISLKDYLMKIAKNPETIDEVLQSLFDETEIQREMIRMKKNSKKAKIREQAEKRLYGKPTTKRRITMTNKFKDLVFSKFNNECAICGAKEGLHIHHKDENPEHNDLSNLVLLCGVCHKKVHMRVR